MASFVFKAIYCVCVKYFEFATALIANVPSTSRYFDQSISRILEYKALSCLALNIVMDFSTRIAVRNSRLQRYNIFLSPSKMTPRLTTSISVTPIARSSAANTCSKPSSVVATIFDFSRLFASGFFSTAIVLSSKFPAC